MVATDWVRLVGTIAVDELGKSLPGKYWLWVVLDWDSLAITVELEGVDRLLLEVCWLWSELS